MNIQQAKQEISNTLRAYLRKDALGGYLFPTVRQRPILLMGPPGIGKTAIMEQIAEECCVGLVAYTITHHTRQSAIGLPRIETKIYDGKEVSVTEYTMSEIIASVYESMERTGVREGILFLDEINCVSETLAPTMLQFLQNKTFGSHKVPDGWIIVAAGNPPEYNKSVREFDIVTLDRVRQIDVEADVDVWLDYARTKHLHGAILSYLSAKKDRFYMIRRTADSLSFVTARGWEDLSEILLGYEELQAPVTESLIAQYLHCEATTRDFAAYYRLFQKYRTDYAADEILHGNLTDSVYAEKVSMARSADFDERLTVVNLILSVLQHSLTQYAWQDAVVVRLHDMLKQYQRLDQTLEQFVLANKHSLDVKISHNLISSSEIRREQWVLNRLMEMDLAAKEQHTRERSEYIDLLRVLFDEDKQCRTNLVDVIQKELKNAFQFASDSFGDGQEMILLVSALTRMPDSLEYIRMHGCEVYLRYADLLMYRQRETELQQACRELQTI